jgi:hypothetical protein
VAASFTVAEDVKTETETEEGDRFLSYIEAAGTHIEMHLLGSPADFLFAM